LGAVTAGDLKYMANPLDTLTKPLQFGAKVAFGAVAGIQQALKGSGGEQQQPEQPQEPEQPQQPRAQQQRKPAQRRNTRPKPLDDKTITDKVETELFRDENVAKGKIDVNTADGVVWLRGEAKSPEQIKELEAKALAIPEVKQVENLLHLPKTPAPSRADTPPTQQKTRRHKNAGAARKVTPARVTSERKTTTAAGAEATPKELADKHEGRQPAPLGSHEAEGIEKVSSDDKTVEAEGGEPTPKELASKGKGRKATPLGSTGNGKS
jgi:BON domain